MCFLHISFIGQKYWFVLILYRSWDVFECLKEWTKNTLEESQNDVTRMTMKKGMKTWGQQATLVRGARWRIHVLSNSKKIRTNEDSGWHLMVNLRTRVAGRKLLFLIWQEFISFFLKTIKGVFKVFKKGKIQQSFEDFGAPRRLEKMRRWMIPNGVKSSSFFLKFLWA